MCSPEQSADLVSKVGLVLQLYKQSERPDIWGESEGNEQYKDSFIKDCNTIPDNLYECESLVTKLLIDIAAEHNSVVPGIFVKLNYLETNDVLIL